MTSTPAHEAQEPAAHLNGRPGYLLWRSRWSARALWGGLEVFGLSMAILILGGSLWDRPSVATMTAVVVVANGILFAFPWLARRRKLGRPPVPPWRPGWVVDVAVGMVALVALVAILAAAMIAPSPFGRFLPRWDMAEYALYALEAPLREPNLWWLPVTWIISYPIADEVFHRGFLIGAFRKRMPRMLAVLFSSIIFGLSGGILWHLEWTVYFIRVGWVLSGLLLVLHGSVYYILAGWVLGGVYLWRKTLTAPLIAHLGSVVVMTLVGLATLLTREAEPLAATAPHPPIQADEVGGGRPRIGFEFAPWAAEARVGRALPGSPAESAGLRTGDTIIGVDHHPVRVSHDLVFLVREHYRPGDTVTLRIRRVRREHEVEVRLAGVTVFDSRGADVE